MTADHLLLLSLLLFAHFLGDFTPLATPGMRAAKEGNGPVAGIGAHAGVHAALVLAVLVLSRVPVRLALAGAAIELVTHLGIDWTRMRLGRASPALRDPGKDAFWRALGVDQLAHGLVLVSIAALVR